MKKLVPKEFNAQGFIPMMLCIIGVVVFIIYLVYARVASLSH